MTDVVRDTVELTAPSVRRGHPALTLVAVSLGVMMVALDGTVVAVANPTIQRDLHASLPGLQWVTNGYLLALVALLILGGKLGDRFGRRLMFTIGITGFALGSLGCALSGSIGVLVTCRVVQGMAGAMLMPNTLAILRSTFAAERLTRAVGIWAGASAVAGAAGPVIGGVLVQHVSWESIFLLNLPLGAITLTFTLTVIAESREPVRSKSFDLLGVALLTLGLGALVWALIKAQSHAWLSGDVLGLGIGGLVILALFVLREWNADEPMLPLDIFASRSVSAATALIIIGFIGVFGVMFFIALYLQNVHGRDPVQTGIEMLPLTGTTIVSPTIGSLLTQKLGARPPLVVGMLTIAGALFGLSELGVNSPFNDLWPYLLLLGSGFGFVLTAATQVIVGSIAAERGGIAGGLQTTASQLGGVLGTTLFGSILVYTVGSVLGGKLAVVGVTGQSANAVIAQKEIVGSGIAPVTSRMPESLQQAVTTASRAAFMDGLHSAMIVAAGLSVAGALLGLLVERGDTRTGGHVGGRNRARLRRPPPPASGDVHGRRDWGGAPRRRLRALASQLQR